MRVTIQDTGVGMSKETLGEVLDKFVFEKTRELELKGNPDSRVLEYFYDYVAHNRENNRFFVFFHDYECHKRENTF